MNYKPPKLTTNFWIILGTLTFLIIAYVAYLELYVAQKESRIISTRFRVLDQLGDNINLKIKSYHSNASQIEKKIQDEVDDYYVKLDEKYTKEALVKFFFDQYIDGKRQELLNRDLEVVDYKLDYGSNSDSVSDKIKYENRLTKSETDKYYYFKPFRIVTKEKLSNGKLVSYHDSLLVRTKYESIVSGLIRKDVFDEMIIVRNDTVIFSTLKSDLIIRAGNISNAVLNTSNTNVRSNPDYPDPGISKPLPDINDRFLSGSYTDLILSNKKFKLFYKPVKIGDEYWYIGGLMEFQNMNNAKRGIAPWIIILISMVLIMTVLGLPVIKLKVISKTDQLETGTIISSALTILLGASLLVLFILYLSQNITRNQNTDCRLKELASAIDTTFNGEIVKVIKQLEAYDRDIESNRLSIGDISANSKKSIKDDILNLPKDNPAFPSDYHFADYIFWADNGKQTHLLTPFINPDGRLSRIAHRDYYNNKDEWFFPADSTKKFRLESIISITTGNHKVALSKPSITEDAVVALTSRFYSIVDPILPKNYGFCIIDEGGKVWFHLDKERNLMENFLEESNNSKYIQAVLFNNTSKSVSANYYNKPTRLFILPLKQIPLYLITFYNRDSDTSFISQVLTLVIVSVSVFFLFIFLQIAVLLIIERRFQPKLANNYIINMTGPMAHLHKHNKFLSWIYLVVAVATGFVFHFIGTSESLILVFAVEVITSAFSYRVLNDNDKKGKQLMWYALFNLFLLTLINIILFILVGFSKGIPILFYQVVLLFCLEYVYKTFLRKKRESYKSINRSVIRGYVVFLIAIAVIFAILPTMAFFKIAHDTESEIRLRHLEVDLMKKKEERNAKWNKNYSSLLRTDATKEILSERKNKGIYTDFLNNLAFDGIIDKEIGSNGMIQEHTLLDSLIVFLRPFYDDAISENKYLIYGSDVNNEKQWIKFGRDTLTLRYLSKTEGPQFKSQHYRAITGTMERLNLFIPFHGEAFSGLKGVIYSLFFWLTLIFVLYIFYSLIKFGTRKLFCLDILTDYSQEPFIKMLQDQIEANKDIILVKMNPKDKAQSLEMLIDIDHILDWSNNRKIQDAEKLINNWLKKLKTKQVKVENTASTNITASSNQFNYVSILFDRFEWKYSDPVLFDKKLDILLSFMNRLEVRIIIQTYLHIDKIIEYYKDEIRSNTKTDNNKENVTELDITLHKNILSKLERLKSSTISKPIPVKVVVKSSEVGSLTTGLHTENDLQALIKDELLVSDYLSQFIKPIDRFSKQFTNEIENVDELIINKINSLADDYYEDLYNSCSPDEQYVMFDLADDLIMNPNNVKPILSLLEKGLFVRQNNKINLMNVSFRRFLLSKQLVIDKSALEVKMGKKASSWKGYRVTLILIILGLFAFIALANQEFAANLNQIFILLGGGVAVVTGILGLLSRRGSSVSE